MTGAQVAILAGGRGTRLRERSAGLPKPMVAVGGRPVLEQQIAQCRAAGLTRIALLVHFGHEAIAAHFGDGSRFGVQLEYCLEQTPRGTAGALADALHRLDEHFLVLYGDTWFDIDLATFLNVHVRRGADATLLLHPNDHPQDSDLVELDETGCVHKLWPYPHPPTLPGRNLVNAGLCAMRRQALANLDPVAGSTDLAKNVFPQLLAAGRVLAGHETVEYIKDMGTPERLDCVERDIARGVPERLSLRHLRSCVFIDRDGTLNEEVDHLTRVDQVRLYDGAAAAVRRLNRSGTLAVVVTNQPVIARGELTTAGLDAIHARLDALLGAEGAYLDRLYYCPHHPQRGFAGEVPSLKIDCGCRKPATGLIDSACRDLAIDRSTSWIVGDRAADIVAGQRAGLRTVLVLTGAGHDVAPDQVQPDYAMADLGAAVDWILRGHQASARRLADFVARAVASRVVLIGGQSCSGKTTAAQLLKEAVEGLGRVAHTVSLDGWLRPPDERPEGAGVLARYDMDRAATELAAIAHASTHRSVRWPVHDRASRTLRDGPVHAIGPDDLLIVEGVTALMYPALDALAGLRLHVEIDETLRRQRFQAEYRRRGRAPAEIDALYAVRRADEGAAVESAASSADAVLRLDDAP